MKNWYAKRDIVGEHIFHQIVVSNQALENGASNRPEALVIYARAKVKTEPFKCTFGPLGDEEGTPGMGEGKALSIDDR